MTGTGVCKGARARRVSSESARAVAAAAGAAAASAFGFRPRGLVGSRQDLAPAGTGVLRLGLSHRLAHAGHRRALSQRHAPSGRARATDADRKARLDLGRSRTQNLFARDSRLSVVTERAFARGSHSEKTARQRAHDHQVRYSSNDEHQHFARTSATTAHAQMGSQTDDEKGGKEHREHQRGGIEVLGDGARHPGPSAHDHECDEETADARAHGDGRRYDHRGLQLIETGEAFSVGCHAMKSIPGRSGIVRRALDDRPISGPAAAPATGSRSLTIRGLSSPSQST